MAEWASGSWVAHQLDALNARVAELTRQVDELEKWREKLTCAERISDDEPAPWCLPPPPPAPHK